ncbi:hypothetical protein HaLaN_04012 [Haematococcus lacustris]|uniref:Uncharacterized protein n=1 Tax=Haematococcus lacustris TaxID=44745 RepID=A0A699YQC7_HAELA|nr:hypothetical protein HaLaN_04012 [Haematococcus lacustris]
MYYNTGFEFLVEYLRPLAQLQVLTFLNLDKLQGLTELLQAQPQLHTLRLTGTRIERRQQLDTLLAATQITSIQLYTVEALGTSYANPLVLGTLDISVDDISDPELAAALNLLAHAIKVSVKIKVLSLGTMTDYEDVFSTVPTIVSPALLQHVRVALAQLVAWLQPLQRCCVGKLHGGSLEPSLEFWHQLVQLMPAVQEGLTWCSLMQGLTYLPHKSPAARSHLSTVAAAPGPQHQDPDLIQQPQQPGPGAWLQSAVCLLGSAADITALAPLCRACTRLRFHGGSARALLAFWQQLVQLMRAVQQVTLGSVAGAATEAISSQAATQPATSEPGPSTPPPAKRSKRTKAEPAAEPTQPTKGKAAKAKPAPQPGSLVMRLNRYGQRKAAANKLVMSPDGFVSLPLPRVMA